MYMIMKEMAVKIVTPTQLSLRFFLRCSPSSNRSIPNLPIPAIRHITTPLLLPSAVRTNAISLEEPALDKYTESIESPATAGAQSTYITTLSNRHIIAFNIASFVAFKRAAESLEKLLVTTREELPATMAAVRLTGMELSDLTMELSDIGEEISQNVRGSANVIRAAEEKIKNLKPMAPTAAIQKADDGRAEKDEEGPVLAMIARGLKENLIKGRGILRSLFTYASYAKVAYQYVVSRRKR